MGLEGHIEWLIVIIVKEIRHMCISLEQHKNLNVPNSLSVKELYFQHSASQYQSGLWFLLCHILYCLNVLQWTYIFMYYLCNFKIFKESSTKKIKQEYFFQKMCYGG